MMKGSNNMSDTAGDWTVRGWMKSLADTIQIRLPSCGGYPVRAEGGAGPTILIRLIGAEGDASVVREVTSHLAEFFPEELSKQGPGFAYRISANNSGEDKTVVCTVIFP